MVAKLQNLSTSETEMRYLLVNLKKFSLETLLALSLQRLGFERADARMYTLILIAAIYTCTMIVGKIIF